MKRKKKWIAIFSIEAVLLLLILICVYVLNKWNRIQPPSYEEKDIVPVTNKLEDEVVKIMKGYTTYAVFGVDARNNENLGKGNHGDVVMIVSVNNDTGEIRIASVFRDTYLCISDDESEYGRMTRAYFTGGPQNAINTLNKNFDLQIKDYVTVNWAAVALAINDLGGVDIDVPSSMFGEHMYLNSYIDATVKATGIGSHELKKPGLQTLDGIQAVAYSRVRYIDNDFERTRRQREVVEKMFEKAKKANLATLDRLTNHVMENISTNMTLPQVISLLPSIFKFDIVEQAGFPLQEHRGRIIVNKADMVCPATLEDTARDLHEFLYEDMEYEPSAAVKKISKKIENDG